MLPERGLAPHKRGRVVMLAPESQFSVQVELGADTVRIALEGEFDGSALPTIEDAFVQAGDQDVVLDLDGLTFMDGAAWLAVMAHEHRARDQGRDLRLVNVPSPVRRIFRETKTEYLLRDASGLA
jgi:anti-anti-sigma factor